MMRFDDRLTTLLAVRPLDDRAKSALWAQIADVIAQADANLSSPLRSDAVTRLLEWRHDVTTASRQIVSASLASSRAPADIVALFASDTAEVASPMLQRATLPDNGWEDLIPRLSPGSRNLLRQRRDLSFAAQRALRLFAQGDQTLPPGEAEVAGEPQPIQIRDLVARIEAYRKSHSAAVGVPADAELKRFRFETAADGTIVWADGAPRAALIGLDIATVGELAESGPDDALATALRLRTPCEKGHLKIVGAGPACGSWQVRASPFRDADGSFGGLRGAATRIEPEPHADRGLLAGTLSADSMRQLAHELRTPLNAIRGFSDLIAGQFFGPAPQFYRTLATAVADDARVLDTVIADLDCAARLDMGSVATGDDAHCDAGDAVRKVANELRSSIMVRSLTVRVTAPVGLPEIGMASEAAEALVRRLLAIAIGFASADQSIAVSVAADHGVRLSVDRPATLAGLSAGQLLRNTVGSDDGFPFAPPLGLGFSLRLVDALAKAHGGSFEMRADDFRLRFPPLRQSFAQVA